MKTTKSKPVLLVAGASGFIGKALAPCVSEDFNVVGLSRSERSAGNGFDEFRKCDLFSLKETEEAVAGATYAVYLVHSMMPSARLTQGDFADLDVVCADNFARACARSGVKQIVYLGGLCPDEGPISKHLESRREIEKVLGSHGVPVTTLRAGLILGARGSSFQVLTRLVQRLPFMVCPGWTNTRTHAVAESDVIRWLQFVIGNEECAGRTFDVGASDTITYRGMMKLVAELLGKRRFFFAVPFMSPGLSRLWVTLVTGAPKALISPLVQSLKHSMVAKNDDLATLSGVQARSTRAALAEALQTNDSKTLESPLAFVGAKSSVENKVRSVQRMQMPTGWSARDATNEYMRWLPSYLQAIIQVESSPERGALQFKFRPTGTTLLELQHAPDRSASARQLFYVTGGLLSKQSKNARFEIRQVMGGRTLLTVVHDYVPRLPWLLYTLTQAKFHQWLMLRFGAHLGGATTKLITAESKA